MQSRSTNRLKIPATLAARHCILTGAALLIGFIQSAHGAATTLWMRQETNSATLQMIERTAGTSSLTLPFSNTKTYDFYSAPLTSSISLTTADKAGGVIYMRNTAAVGAFDFSVTGRMQYFDYDPVTHSNALIGDTGTSTKQKINHGQTVNWAIPNVALPAARTLSSGHLLHVAVTISVTDGFPGFFGFLVYNGSSGTQALFPQNRGVSFPLSAVKPKAPASISGWTAADGKYSMTVSGAPGASYRIEATTNLSSPVWNSLTTTNANTNGLLIFKDVDSSKYPARFYRAVSQ